MKDGRPFTFAGLWEGWKDPESGEWLRTCTIVTGEPNELVRADPSLWEPLHAEPAQTATAALELLRE
jgi:hypothetical protein